MNLKDLKCGDVLEYGRLFPAAVKEPILWEVISVTKEKDIAIVRGTFLGVDIGLFTITKNGDELEWEDE